MPKKVNLEPIFIGDDWIGINKLTLKSTTADISDYVLKFYLEDNNKDVLNFKELTKTVVSPNEIYVSLSIEKAKTKLIDPQLLTYYITLTKPDTTIKTLLVGNVRCITRSEYA